MWRVMKMHKEKTEVLLKRFAGVKSGEKVFVETRLAVYKTKEVKKSQNGVDGGRGILEYLLPGSKILVSPGDIIEENSESHEIIETKVCRDMSGKICAVRCTTLN